jgi:acyl-CoA hydrolase/GNAT superfamily N-acetyltransferase
MQNVRNGLNNMMEKSWSSKQVTLNQVPEKVPNGSRIYIGSTAATAQASVGALVNDGRLVDIEFYLLIPGGDQPHLAETLDRFRTRTFYALGKPMTSSVNQGLADYMPSSISQLPRLLEEKLLELDIAIIKVSAPQNGYCSLGIGVDYTQEMIRHAKIVIAEVTTHMPWTCGGPCTQVSVNDIDWWVDHDEPLGSLEELFPFLVPSPVSPNHSQQDVHDRIGKNLIHLIPHGGTLKFTLYQLASTSILPYLHERKDIGIHTDMIDDRFMPLIQNGTITNAKKEIDQGKSIVSHACGSKEFYKFLHNNPAVEFRSLEYVTNPQVMGQIKNFCAIMAGLKVDLSGQVAAESIGFQFYGGVGSTVESLRGAALSEGGKPIIALPSKSAKGYSNIVAALPPGTGVTVTRSEIEYVVTEYGTAYLFGKTIRERCLALINIAHPDFRHELLAVAKEFNYVQEAQPGLSFHSTYPEEWECLHQTKKGKDVFVRPIKAIDEALLRNFFHKLSNQSIYMRYFRKLRSLPQAILKKTADIDYSTNMALVALYPPGDEAHHEIVAIGQWVADPRGGMPEIAFQVRDDWQGNGLGKYLFNQLVKMSTNFGVSHFKADVLAGNKAMNKAFVNAGIPYTRSIDFGVYTYRFDLTTPPPASLEENMDT